MATKSLNLKHLYWSTFLSFGKIRQQPFELSLKCKVRKWRKWQRRCSNFTLGKCWTNHKTLLSLLFLFVLFYVTTRFTLNLQQTLKQQNLKSWKRSLCVLCYLWNQEKNKKLQTLVMLLHLLSWKTRFLKLSKIDDQKPKKHHM